MGVAALLAVALPLAVFIPFAAEAWNERTFGWDIHISQRLHAYDTRHTVLNRYVDVFGLVLNPALQVLVAIAVCVALVLLVARRRSQAALVLGVSVAGAVIAGPLLKELFQTPPISPWGTGYSFPSGHALRTMALAGALAVLAWPTTWRRAALLVGSIGVMLTSVALVYEGWHSAGDVIGGWVLGVAWVASVCLAVRFLYRYRVADDAWRGGALDTVASTIPASTDHDRSGRARAPTTRRADPDVRARLVAKD